MRLPPPHPVPRARDAPLPTSHGGDWLGPLAGWELLRAARRGDPFRARLAAASLLALAVAAAGWAAFPDTFWASVRFGPTPEVPLGRLNGFAAFFAAAVFASQAAVAVLLTPGYVAAAFATEKDRRTLAVLLTTPLTDGELVRGKYAARTAEVLGVVAVALPVLLYVLPSGGVDPVAVVTAYALLGGAVLFLGSLGALAGCRAADFNRAVVRAYAWAAGYLLLVGNPCCACLPLGAVLGLFAEPDGVPPGVVGMTWGYAALHVGAAAVVLRAAVRSLRPNAAPPDVGKLKLSAKPLEPAPPEPPRPEVDPALFVVTPFFAPPVSKPPPPRPVLLDDDPIAWKERYVTGTLPVLESATARALGDEVVRIAQRAVGCTTAAVALVVVLKGAESPPLLFLLLAVGGAVLAAAEFTAVGSAAAVTIARERRKGTLDGLLALPVDRAVILAAKRAACRDRLSWWGVAAVGGTWLGFASHGLGPAFLAAGVLVAGGGFVVAYGMWLSARHDDTGPALRRLMPVVGFVAAAPALAWLTAREVLPPSAGPIGSPWLNAGLVGAIVVLWAAGGRFQRAVRRNLERGEGPPPAPRR